MSVVHIGNRSLDELVFADRNKLYGAYAIRKAYPRHLLQSFLIPIGSIVLITGMLHVIPDASIPPVTAVPERSVIVELSKPPQFVIEVSPAHPEQGIRIREQTPSNNLRIVADPLVQQQQRPENPIQPTNPNVSPSTVTGNGSIDGNPTGTIGTPHTGAIDPPSPPEVFDFVSAMPEFPGGEHAMRQFLNDRLHYPPQALEAGKYGKVVVEFLVDEKGKLYDFKVIKKLGWGFDEEALRVLSLMPLWTPGKQNSKSVTVRVRLPIHFTLDE